MSSSSTPPPRHWARAARLVDLASDGPHALDADGIELVAVRTPAGVLRVFEGRCPHQGALLGEGELEDGALVCRNHRWRFDAESGRRDGGPECLRACASEPRGDALWVDIGPLRVDEARTRPRRAIRDLPGPRGLPILGNAHQLDVLRIHQIFEGWSREYGPMYRASIGRAPYVCISDPQLMEQVLRARPETFRRDARIEPLFAEIGAAGVFSAEGAVWRSQRRLAMKALAQKNLTTFFPTLRAVAERLRRRWERSAGAVVDLRDDLMRFTVDVTTALAFGRDLNTVEGGDDVIQQDLALIFPAVARRLNAVWPYWRTVRMPADRRVDRAVANITRWLNELLTERRAHFAADPAAQPSNFLEEMVLARDEHGRPFADDVILGNCMTMLLGGEDTTANSLAWAVHILCDHPAEVRALSAELDAVLGGATLPVDLEQANALPRATAVTNESMRLIPVAPISFLSAIHDTVVGDVDLPAGTRVVLIGRIGATAATSFADPMTFRPTRWLDHGPGAHEPGASLPFGSGPRICPGRNLAMVEMRLLLATLYRNFDVERVGTAADVKEHFAFTVVPSDLRVRLRPR